MISAQKLSGLLAALYAAPLEDGHWQVFLDDLCEQVRAQIGLFAATNARLGSNEILAQGGIGYNPDMQRLYNQYYGRVDPYRIAFQRKPRIGAIVGEELVAAEEAEKTEFYNDLAVPTGVKHSMVLPAALLPNGVESVSVWRSPKQKPFRGSSVQLFELLLPHVQAALRVRHLLELSKTRAGQLAAALDASATATFILSDAGEVVHHNQYAEGLLRLQDGLAIRQKKLQATDSRAHAVLRSLIASAAIAGGASLSQPGGAVALPRNSGKRPLSAIVSPLRVPGATVPAHVLVLVTDPDRRPVSEVQLLAELFGLTQAEARLARILATGDSLKEASEQLGVADSTVRSQLKALFAKTRTNRQTQLVRLLLLTLPQITKGEL